MSKLVEPLLPLQELDLEIHHLKVRRDEKPRELASHQEKLDRAKTSLETLHGEIKALKLEGGRRELEVKEMDARIQKLVVQSNQAKKNDEYQALLKEISGIKADKSRIEDGLLDIYMQVDEKAKLQKIRAEEVEAAQREYDEAKKRIDEEVAAVNREMEQILDRRRERAEGVNAEVLKAYERILAAKDDGVAIAVVEFHVILEEGGKVAQWMCGGCNVNVPAQEVNLSMLARDIVRCRSCSRILYVRKPD